MDKTSETALSAREVAFRAINALETIQVDLEDAGALVNLLATAEDMDPRTVGAFRAIDNYLSKLAAYASAETMQFR